MIDFPNSPSVGQTFTSGGQTWIWDGTKWVVAGATGGSSIYLPLTGGTLTGPLANSPITGGSRVGGTIDNAPIGQTTPAAGSFTNVQAASLNGGPLAGMRNRLINGAMLIDQRGLATAGFSPASATYFIDRWQFSGSQTGKIGFYMAQTSLPAGAVSFAAGYVLATATIAAGDFFAILQPIEANNTADLGFGTASAKPVAISFLAYSALAGTHSGSLSNGAATRSYPFTFSIPAANTWTLIAVTIPGDTAGTWPAASNGSGMLLRFNLGAGSTFLAPAGAWAAGNFCGATGSVQIAAGAINSDLRLTNVQLEQGSVATPFERRLYGAELALCQRYYQRYTGTAAAVQLNGYGTATQNVTNTMLFATMRAAPTGAFIGTWTLTNVSGLSVLAASNSAVLIYGVASATGVVNAASPANGGFDLSAEL